MRQNLLPLVLIIALSAVAFLAFRPAAVKTERVVAQTSNTAAPKIQAAILLDVSGSMDGLIEQAKAQLWNMVSIMGKAQCDGKTPNIEIALYEYGRTNNPAPAGYVKQIMPFTTDLDTLSKELFKLATNGGDEYCGQVIYTSLKDLAWDTSAASYKVIFIAGNEDFLQGSLHYTKACAEAKKKGVIVNTIYCGDKQQGIRENWNLAGECGNGSYTHINQNSQLEDIPTPHDSILFVYNNQLNGTYMAYGARGASKFAEQAEADAGYYKLNKSAAAKRASVKGNKALYRNDTWDLVDAYEKDSNMVKKLPQASLPADLRGKAPGVVVTEIKTKAVQRSQLQKSLDSTNTLREKYLVEARKAAANTAAENTLESEIERIIRSQAIRYRMTIK